MDYELIEEWLVGTIAFLSNTQPERIDVDKAFVDYALDSSLAVTLAEEIAKWVGQPLSATLFWEYPTIRLLAAALSAGEASP